MKLITAKVKGNPREVTTKYGQRTVMDVWLESGENVTIWGSSGCNEILGRRDGERVKVALDSKGKYHVVEYCGSGVATMPEPVTSKELQPEYTAHNGRSAEIADYVERLGKLYSHCHKAAKANVIDGDLDHEDYRTIATTLFIQTVKHFDL